MASETLIEAGVGETRVAVIENGRIAEAHIERWSDGLRAGAVHDAKLTRIHDRGAIVSIGGIEALIEPRPAGVAEGGRLRVEVVREAIPEPGRPRLAKVKKHASASASSSFPSALADRFPAARPLLAHQRDALEAAGWSEMIEEARTGIVAFDGGLLTISLTPAMTVIDVDGALPPADLAVAGARAAGEAIRRLGITGSIGIDLPTVPDKAARLAAAAALDAALPPPFERTAVNGFGFLQVIRRRLRPSLLERLQGAPVESAALALLRQAERAGAGGLGLVAAPGVIAWLEANPPLIAELERRIGGRAALRRDTGSAISAGHVAPPDA